jgi:hypothetical protein
MKSILVCIAKIQKIHFYVFECNDDPFRLA